MEESKLFSPVYAQLEQLEGQIQRLRSQLVTQRTEVATVVTQRVDAALDGVESRVRDLAASWQKRGEALVEQNRKAADGTLARLEGWIANLRAEATQLLGKLGAADDAGDPTSDG